MRVLFLVTDYPSALHPVPGMFHRTQAEALARRGAEVDVVAPMPWVPPGLRLLGGKWRDYSDVPPEYEYGPAHVRRPRYVHWPKRNFVGTGADAAFARAAVACAPARPDVIHAHFAYPPGLAALRLRRRWKVPTLLTLHGSDVNRYPFVNARSRRRFIEAVTGADAVIAVSGALADTSERLTGRRPAVAPIGIGMETYRRLPAKSSARKELSLDPSGAIVLYVGNLAPEKGVPELTQALANLADSGKNIRGVFVGWGPLRGALKSARNVLSVGVEPNERIPLYMAAADVLVLPSHSEGMPTVLVEAGAGGLPVIASRVGGIPELLAEERGFLIEPHSVDEVEKAIHTVLNDPGESSRRAERLRAYVQAHYDADRNAGHLLKIYEELS